MFRPTQNLLFHPLPALHKVFKIHQPLPLSPRESQQLLSLLTTSFRKHLDSEHPQLRTDKVSSPEATSTSHNDTPKLRRQPSSDPEKHYTDRHMHSLLTNPLFTLPKPKVVVDPMDTFDRAVANGMMTTHYAHTCLKMKKLDLIRSSVLSVREGMRESGAGLKVLKWLISSGTTKDLTFLKDVQFGRVLFEFMVAEGLQEAIWPWIKKAFQDIPSLALLEPHAYEQARTDIVNPLKYLVSAECSPGESLDAAYTCMSRATGYLKGLKASTIRQVLGSPGIFLLKQSAADRGDRPPPSETAFESFLSLVPVMTRHIDLHLAQLALLHPTKPDPELALNFLRALDSSRVAEPQMFRRNAYHVELGLDAAKYLLENGRFTEAEWVMEHLSSLYPKQLGVKRNRQIKEANAEASSLESLAGLSFA
jgi:hypothetical protein